MSSGISVFRRRWSPTGAPNSSPMCGRAFFWLMGVTVSLSSGYHPQTNGQTERKIQELGRCLRSYCHDDQHSWSRFLPWAEYAQNSLRQDTTRLTPFKCILGHQPPLFLWTGEPSEVPDLDYWFRARERGTQLTSIFSVLCGGIRPLQIPVTSIPQHSSQGIKCGCPPGICASANRAESWVPIVLVRSPSRGRLTKSPTDYNFHPGTAFTLSSTSPTFNYSLHLHQDPPSRRHPPLPEILDQPSRTFWMCGDGWPAGMSHRLGWIRTWREILGGPGRRNRSHTVDWIPQSFPDCPAPRGCGRPRRCSRTSGAAPGGGVNVRVSTPSQSPQSLVTTLTRSQSPEYWSPAPAVCNQHSFIYTRHSDTHHPVYCSHTWASLTVSILAYMCLPSDLQYSCDSRSPQFQHDPDPTAKSPTSVITDKNQRTAICVSAHLVSVSALSFNKPVIKTSLYSLTSCLWPVLWQYGAYNASLYYA